MRSPIKGALANPLVKQLRREDRRGSARLARKKVRACALRAYPRPSSVGLLGNGLLSMPLELWTSAPTFCCGLVDNNQ